MAKEKKKKKGKEPTAPIDPNQKALEDLYGKKGTAAGEALINKFIPEGSLGRVSTEIPGQSQYLEMLKGGLGGYTSPQYQAQREQMMQGVNSQYATAQSQLAKAQARGKVYGAAGAAQQANLIQSTQDNKNNLEQQLYVKNIDEMQNRLKTYGSENAAANAATLDREKTNLGQVAAEKSGQIGAFEGAAGTNLLQDYLAKMQAIQKKGLNAVR